MKEHWAGESEGSCRYWCPLLHADDLILMSENFNNSCMHLQASVNSVNMVEFEPQTLPKKHKRSEHNTWPGTLYNMLFAMILGHRIAVKAEGEGIKAKG